MGSQADTNGNSRLLAERLEARYRRVLVKFFSRKLDDPSEAEDFAQEVLIRLIAGGNGNVKNPDAYVFQIAGNLTRDHARKRMVRRKYLNDQLAVPDRGVDTIDPDPGNRRITVDAGERINVFVAQPIDFSRDER